jgi:hypothetical protein
VQLGEKTELNIYKNYSSMESTKNKINRRDFTILSGTAAAGIALIPDTLLGKSMQKKGNWWEVEPLRIVELEQGYEYSEKFEILRDLGANMEHATRFTGTSPGTSFLDAHNLFSGKKVDYESVDDYLKEAHKRDIRVIIYYNVHAIEINYARQHPDWQQIKSDGKPIEDVYSVDSSFCINSPWREEVFATLRKMCDYPIDGIFYDGPIFFGSTCYCKSCRKKFRDRYNRELPDKTDLSGKRQNQGWKDIIDFQSDSLAEFLRESNRIIKQKNPQILFYMNGNTLAPSWPTARNNRKIAKETDILGAEGGFLYGELKEPVYKPGAMAKLLETQSGGKPTVVFDAAKQGPWTFSKLPAGEISLLYSQTITYQANVWLAVSAIANLQKEEMDVIRKFNRLISENPEPFIRTKQMAEIALVWPQRSGNYYSGSSIPLTDFTKESKTEKAGNTEEEFYGFYDGLARTHFPFDVIDEEALCGDIARYRLIILPNVSCLSAEENECLKNFVRNGGNLISTFETSLYDETGNKNANPGLADILGNTGSGEIFGPLNWDYLVPADLKHFSLKGIKNKYLNSPTYGMKIKSSGNSPVRFCKPLPGSYSGSPEPTEFPFLTENIYGKGRSSYFAGTFGGSLKKFHFPEYYQILENIASEYVDRFIVLKNAPSSVEVNVRKNKGSVFVYLINFTSEMRRPVQEIIRCSNIEIELKMKSKAVRISTLCSRENLNFKTENGTVQFTVPKLDDFEVIRIDF